jgi:hypothetical protein
MRIDLKNEKETQIKLFCLKFSFFVPEKKISGLVIGQTIFIPKIL